MSLNYIRTGIKTTLVRNSVLFESSRLYECLMFLLTYKYEYICLFSEPKCKIIIFKMIQNIRNTTYLISSNILNIFVLFGRFYGAKRHFIVVK